MSIYDPPDKPRKTTSPYYGSNPLLPISRVNPPSKDFYWEHRSRERNDFGPPTNYQWEPTKPTPPNQFFNYTAPAPVPKPTPTNPFFNFTPKWEEPKKFNQFFKYTAPAPVPTPTNPFFNYTAPAPYNNPFKYYKEAPKVEGDIEFPIVRPQTKFNPAMVPGYTERKEQIYGKEFVASIDKFIAESQPRWDLLKVSDPKRYKQIMRNLGLTENMINQQKLRVSPFPEDKYAPILGDEALMRGLQEDNLEQRKKSLGGVMAFVDDTKRQLFGKDIFQRYSTWLNPDLKGRPVSGLGAKMVGGHEGDHIRGYIDPVFREQQLNNYGSFITSDITNRKEMERRLKFAQFGLDYEASPEEMFSRREEARRYIIDNYGSDEFHKLTAKDAVRIWQEAYRVARGAKGNDYSFQEGRAPLRYPWYFKGHDMTDEQIRLLLQNNFGRYPTYNAGGNYGSSGFGR